MTDSGEASGHGWVCPTCDRHNPEGAPFCGRCGERTEEPKVEAPSHEPPIRQRALPVTLGAVVVVVLAAVAVAAFAGLDSQPGGRSSPEGPGPGSTGGAAPELTEASPNAAGCWHGGIAVDCSVLSALTPEAASRSAGTGLLTAPTVGGQPFVAIGTGRDGGVYRLDVDNGQATVGWTRFLSRPVQIAPTAVPSTVFVAGVGGDHAGSRLFALDADDGRVLWQRQLDVRVRLPSVAVDEDSIAVAGDVSDSDNDELLVVDVAGGEVLQRSTVAGHVLSLTSDSGRGVVYYTDGSGLHAFDPGVGELWAVPGDHVGPLKPGTTTLYVSQFDGTLTARAANNNTVPWTVSDLDGVHYPPVADDDTVVAIDDHGRIHAFDARTGEALGTVPTQDVGAVTDQAVLFGDTVAIPTVSGLLFANLSSGRTAVFRPRGEGSNHNQISGVEPVGDGVLLVTASAGVFVLDSPTLR